MTARPSVAPLAVCLTLLALPASALGPADAGVADAGFVSVLQAEGGASAASTELRASTLDDGYVSAANTVSTRKPAVDGGLPRASELGGMEALAAGAPADGGSVDAAPADGGPTFIGDQHQRLIATPAQAAAKPGALVGVVRTATGEPISNATLLVERLERLATTDSEGRYRLELPPGRHRIFLSPPGYLPESPRVTIRTGETTTLELTVQPLPFSPESPAVVFRRRGDVARITLSQRELHETAGTLGDPLRAVLFLPGTSQLLSGLPNAGIRGMQPAATAYFLDGVRLTNPYHLFVGPSVVSPDLLESLEVYRGGAPVRFGRALSVVDLQLAPPRDDRVHVTATLDALGGGLIADVPLLATGTNVTLSGRFFYTPFLAARALSSPDTQRSAVLVDGLLRVEQTVGAGKVRLLAFTSSDGVGSNNPLVEHLMLGAAQSRFDVRVLYPLLGGELEAAATVGVDRARFTGGGPATTWELGVSEESVGSRAAYSRFLREDIRISFGLELERRGASYRQGATIAAPVVDGSEDPPVALSASRPLGAVTTVSFHTQAFYARESRWAWIPGLRVDSVSDDRGHGYLTADPRLLVQRALTDDLTLKGGVGLFHMAPTSLVGLPGSEAGLLRLGVQEAFQVDVALEWRPLANVELSADVFYMPLLRTAESSPFDGDLLPSLTASAEDATRLKVSTGNAWGFELFARRPPRGNWYGWLSYSFQQSYRKRQYPRRDERGEQIALHFQDLPFANVPVHTVTAAGSVRLPWGFVLGGSLHLNSGALEAGGLTSVTRRRSLDEAGTPVWLDADEDERSRLPPFFRLDLRVAKVFDFGAWSLEAWLDVQNLTFAKEIFRYDYAVEADSLEAREQGDVRLVRKAVASPIPPLPMLGLRAVY